MGRFQGSAAENCVAEAMIHGWESVCKLWEASSLLDTYASADVVVDSMDMTVRENLGSALQLLEAALTKFSCHSVYGIIGDTYNPMLHELDPSDPELDALRRGSGGINTVDSLCGASIAAVVRPGLEVSGILRARPRVRVALASRLPCRLSPAGSSSSTALAASASATEPVAALLGNVAAPAPAAKRAELAADARPAADAAAAASVAPCKPSRHTVRTSVVQHNGDQTVVAEGSEGRVARQECSAGSVSGRAHYLDSVAAMSYTGNGPNQGPASISAPLAGSDAGGSSSGGSSAAPLAAAAAAAAAHRGPLQLLLALRAGSGGAGDGGVAPKDVIDSSAGAGVGPKATKCLASLQNDPAARRREPKGFGEASDVAQDGGAGCDIYTSGDDGDSGHDDVVYQQYDTSMHHPAGYHPPQRTAPQLIPQPQGQQQHHAQPASEAVAAAPSGVTAFGVPPSSSAVPVLLALDRAAASAAAAFGRVLPPGPPLTMAGQLSAGPAPTWHYCAVAAAGHIPGQPAGVPASVAPGSSYDAVRPQGASRTDAAAVDGSTCSGSSRGASGDSGNGSGAPPRGAGSGNTYSGLASTLAAATALKAAATAASRAGTPVAALPSGVPRAPAARTAQEVSSSAAVHAETPKAGLGLADAAAGSAARPAQPACASDAAGCPGKARVDGFRRREGAAEATGARPGTGRSDVVLGFTAVAASAAECAISAPQPPRQSGAPAHAQLQAWEEQQRQQAPACRQLPYSRDDHVSFAPEKEDGQSELHACGQGSADCGVAGQGARLRDRAASVEAADAASLEQRINRGSWRSAAPAPQDQPQQQQWQHFERADQQRWPYNTTQPRKPYERHPAPGTPLSPQPAAVAAPKSGGGSSSASGAPIAKILLDDGPTEPSYTVGGDFRPEEWDGRESGAGGVSGRRGGGGGRGWRPRGGYRRGGRGGAGWKRRGGGMGAGGGDAALDAQ